MTNKCEKKMYKDVSSNLNISNWSRIVAWAIIFKNCRINAHFGKIVTILRFYDFIYLNRFNDFTSDFTHK